MATTRIPAAIRARDPRDRVRDGTEAHSRPGAARRARSAAGGRSRRVEEPGRPFPPPPGATRSCQISPSPRSSSAAVSASAPVTDDVRDDHQPPARDAVRHDAPGENREHERRARRREDEPDVGDRPGEVEHRERQREQEHRVAEHRDRLAGSRGARTRARCRTAEQLRSAEAAQALAQAVAPVRQLGRALLRAEHRVRRPRRPRAELGRRDPPDAAVEAGLLEDRLGELRPGAVAGRRDVVDAVGQRDDVGGRRRRGARCRSGSRAGRRRRSPRRARRRAAASSGRSCGRPARRATTSGRSTPRRRRLPRRGASCGRRRRADAGASDSTYGSPLRAVEDVVGREVDERRAELGGVLRAADVDRRSALRVVLGAVDVRPRGRVQDELDAAGVRKREADVPLARA